MRRFWCLALAVLFCFGGCGTANADTAPLKTAITGQGFKTNSKFTLNITFGEEEKATLLFAMGSFEADYENNTLSAEMARTVLASASRVSLSYDGSVCKTTVDGEEHTEEMTPEAVFGGLIYTRPFLPEDLENSRVTLSSDGLYTVKCKTADSTRLFGLLGDDIYQIAKINVPKKEKMYCSDAVFTYRIKDGKICDYGLSYEVHLFETPPYIPNQKVDESDYELVLWVDFSASYEEIQ